ncbi:helix-turn-helix transcriptional regulator [Streptomyces sp. NPDC093990]|uniref:helix-turn-helix transcriptional regulator n=1 Tax=Streptomyces sp. NPDC093990 TaxID=3155306 RepID=UPI003432FC12
MDGDLGDFLRSRRARIRPEEVGLPSHGRRRVPGLRREEVAQLAGVSVDYYIRLEQGRGPGGPSRTKSGGVSDAVLDAVARVLRLDETERAYLHAVARPRRQARRPDRPRVRPAVQLMIDAMDRSPAFVLDRRMTVLAWNPVADAVFGYSGATDEARSIPRYVFLDPAARDFYPEWPAVAAQSVAHLRILAAHHQDDRELTSLVGELSLKSEDFRRLWADHQVKECAYGVKRLQHPVAGLLVFPYETLTIPGDGDQSLLVYTPEPGSETEERLALLGSWASSPAR